MANRPSYHHGDLHAALVTASVELARDGGEPAVRLNRIATQLGVSPAAVYRHFPDGIEGLLVAVGDVARRELTELILARIDQATGSRDAALAARRRFRASGRAYVEYVTAQPGLFQVASRHDRGPGAGADPHALLERCLDDLVDAGALPPERRRHASAAAWAAVHGIAVLLTEGPLRRLPDPERHRVIERTLDMVQSGL